MKKRGTGFASAWQGSNTHFGHHDTSTVHLELTRELRYRVGVAAADLGQGLTETLRAIVSQAMGGVPLQQIDIVDPDTGATPDGGATGASRQTAMTGNATFKACQQLAEALKLAASELIATPTSEVVLHEGRLYGRDGASVALQRVVEECRRMGLRLSATACFQGPATEPLDDQGQGFGVNEFGYATYMAEVEVDTDTGEVQVLRVATFIDAGRIVRQEGAEMQVEGGVAMALGHSLTEDLKLRDGWPLTGSLSTYLIPTTKDVPLEITSHFVDGHSPLGELGAKGMAELVLVPVAPAITNAIYDAVGVRITRLPATPERVLQGLLELQDGQYGEQA